jgi:ABC-type transport system involved in multi-copper enzyme maturation permease subunit
VKRLVGGELLKVRTTRVAASLLAGTLALTGLQVLGTIFGAGRQGTPSLHTSAGIRNVFGSGGTAALFGLLLGILLVTTEVRHGTITQTFLVTPGRARVVTAKLVAMALVGAAFGAAASVLTVVLALPILAAKHVGVPLTGADVGPVLAAVVVSTALFAMIGVGVGALIRNQVAALVAALVWELVLEAILVGLVPSVGRWLPGGAARALGRETISRGSLLPAWAGGLLLLAYGLAFVAVGTTLVVRRDVT